MEKYQLNKNIMCIDLKSFYASVECALNDFDPFNTPLVVADLSRGNGALCLAVTPYLKKYGIPNRIRVFDLKKFTNETIIYAKPKMRTYMKYSIKVIEILLKYVSYDDIYVYSIDETFVDLTNYLKLYKLSDYDLTKKIKDDILNTLKLHSTCGIGPNMLMAKLSMDLEAKNTIEGIAKWDYSDVKTKLWKVTPLSKMWGIGSRREKHLNDLGLYTIGDIANSSEKRLKRLFGVLGTELWYHTHGIDLSLIQDKDILRNKSKSVGLSQILFSDYYSPNIYIIIKEMLDEVLRRLRLTKHKAKTIRISCGYNKDTGGGFSKQTTLLNPTNSYYLLLDELLNLFNNSYDHNSPIRSISISLTNLIKTNLYQYSLFEDHLYLEKELKLLETIDSIKINHGKNSVNRGSSLDDASTIIARNKMVGGHNG
ncbi:MAG: damage repair protein [Acholeplasmataceae bacterium]